MTCEECLSVIASAPILEVREDSRAREHCATCAECSRVVALVAEGERDMAFALNNLSSTIPASQTAERAIAAVGRRKTGRVLAGVFAVLIVIVLWITWIQVIVPGMRATADIVGVDHRTETLELRCLSPDQAGDLISPYVRSNGSAWYPGKPPLSVITVRANPDELARVKELLQRFDNPAETSCRR